MSALAPIIDQLRAALAEAEARRDAAALEVARLAGALEALGGEPVDAEPDPQLAKFAARAKAQQARDEKTTRRVARGSVDHAEVARVANEARAAGKPMGRAVAAHFGIKIPAADMRIKAARAAGHDIPAGQPRKAATPPTAQPRPEPWTAERAAAALGEMNGGGGE